MFATATLLLPLSKLGMRSDLAPQLLQSVEMAVEILEAMDESVVARKSVGIIKHYLRGLRASSTRSEPGIGNDTGGNYETAFLPTDTGSNQPGVDIPVRKRLTTWSDLFSLIQRRSGRMALCSLITRLKELRDFSMIWEPSQH